VVMRNVARDSANGRAFQAAFSVSKSRC